jgi:hypothetical protein
MVDRSEGDLRSNLMTEILEQVVIEFLGTINGDFLRDTIAADYVLLEKILDGCKAYVCDRLRLDPLCEIFNCDNNNGVVALS